MTFLELKAALAEAGIPDADTDARLLLTHFCGISRAALQADLQKNYESPLLCDALRRRLSREPLQHIFGEAWFFEECYEVSADCLIPRADTELLVEYAIKVLPQGAHFVDLCTGSGCIAISVCAHRPDLRATAVDISERALAIAERNAKRNQVEGRIAFLLDDVLSPKRIPTDAFDAVLSNPPYIPSAHIQALAPELSFEPHEALDGGEDGLLFYRALLQRFRAPLFLFEIGFDQKADILSLANARGYVAKVLRDLGGNDRLAVLSAL